LRIVKGFPVVLLKSASKTIQASTKKLQEAFSSQESSHSHVRRPFFHKPNLGDSSRSSFDTSIESRHNRLASSFRNRLSFALPDHSINSDSGRNGRRLFHKQGSSDSNSYSSGDENRQSLGNSIREETKVLSVDQSNNDKSKSDRHIPRVTFFCKNTSDNSTQSTSLNDEGQQESLGKGEAHVDRITTEITAASSFDASFASSVDEFLMSLKEVDEESLVEEVIQTQDSCVGDIEPQEAPKIAASQTKGKTWRKKMRRDSSSCAIQ
jgi:hypothetical protein